MRINTTVTPQKQVLYMHAVNEDCSSRAYPDAICVNVWAGVDMPILTDTIPSVLLHSSTASWQMRLQEHMYRSMPKPHVQPRCTCAQAGMHPMQKTVCTSTHLVADR